MQRVDAEPYAFEFDPSASRARHHRHAARLPGTRRLRRRARQRRRPAAQRHRAHRARPARLRAPPACSSCIPARATAPISPTWPPAKHRRGGLATRIGDPGPMGRILVRGEHGHDIIAELAPAPGEPVVDKPGKGAFYATDLEAMLRERGIAQLLVCGVTTEVCVNTTVREANDRGFDCLVLADCAGVVFPGVPGDGPGDDQGAGRHLRLGRRPRPRCSPPCHSQPWPERTELTDRSKTMASARDRTARLVGSRRLERLLRPVHQRGVERHRADRAVPRRGQAAE